MIRRRRATSRSHHRVDTERRAAARAVCADEERHRHRVRGAGVRRHHVHRADRRARDGRAGRVRPRARDGRVVRVREHLRAHWRHARAVQPRELLRVLRGHELLLLRVERRGRVDARGMRRGRVRGERRLVVREQLLLLLLRELMRGRRGRHRRVERRELRR